MTRRVAPLAAAVALAAVATGLLLLLGVPPPTDAERAEALARELRCPDCQGLSVADSPTQVAAEIRRQIDDLLAGGASPDAVRAHFVARYGEWIMLAPASPVVWAIPFLAVVAGAAALLAWLVRSGRAGTGSRRRPSAEVRRRLHEEAEALDA